MGATQGDGSIAERGAVTVYCALVFMLMAALLGSLLEAAHQTGVRARFTQAAKTSMDSLFTMYDEALYEEYGLLFVNEDLLDMTPENQLERFLKLSANPGMGLAGVSPQFLAYQVEQVQVNGCYYAVDDQGVFLEREILELMKYQESASLLNQLKSYLEQIGNADQAYSYVVEQNDSYEETDWAQVAKDAQESAGEEETETEAGSESGSGEEEGTISNEDIDAALDGSIITQIQSILTDTLLSLFVEDVSALSDHQKTGSVTYGVDHGIALDNGLLTNTAQNLLYDEYLMAYMGSYLHPASGDGLAYELEYMVSGSQGDRENLLNVTTKLLLARMGLNIVFLLANRDYYEQAELLAGTLVGWTGLIALVAVVKLMLIAVWAFSESILDVRALLAGKNIPFFKNKDTWVSSISDCVGRVAAGEMAKESSGGLGYEMYMRLFLLMQGMEQKNLRTMNVITWNMQDNGRTGFRFDHCIYGVEMTADCVVTPVFLGMYGQLWPGKNRYGYQVSWSRIY
jgi:hypothetical protein